MGINRKESNRARLYIKNKRDIVFNNTISQNIMAYG